MPDYGNRPRRRAAMEATARLHQQLDQSRVAPRRREPLPNVETQRPTAIPAPLLPPVTDVHRITIPQPIEANNRPQEDDTSLPPVPTTVSSHSPLLPKRLFSSRFKLVDLLSIS